MGRELHEFNLMTFKDRIDTLTDHGLWLMRVDETSPNGRRVRRDLFALNDEYVEVWFNIKMVPYVVRMISYWELNPYLDFIELNYSRNCL